MSKIDFEKYEKDFEIKLFARITKSQFKAVKQAVKKDNERFDNISHFVRVAVLKLLREIEQTRGKNGRKTSLR